MPFQRFLRRNSAADQEPAAAKNTVEICQPGMPMGAYVKRCSSRKCNTTTISGNCVHLQPLITPWQQPDLTAVAVVVAWTPQNTVHLRPARYGDGSPAAASCSRHLLGLKLPECTKPAAAWVVTLIHSPQISFSNLTSEDLPCSPAMTTFPTRLWVQAAPLAAAHLPAPS